MFVYGRTDAANSECVPQNGAVSMASVIPQPWTDERIRTSLENCQIKMQPRCVV